MGGFHYNHMIEEPRRREVITIYEIDATGRCNWAKAIYNYRWTPQTDPDGVLHEIIDYPGVPVAHDTVERNDQVLPGVRVRIRPHFGTMGLAPREADLVDSLPPSYFGGNIDNWRIAPGGTMYFPVAVEGALLSAGDPHAAQGDSEDEAISLMSVAVDFGITQVVDGNWGVHGVLEKSVFAGQD